MASLKSHFRFSRKQRIGILLLVLLIVVLQGIYFFSDFSREPVMDINNTEIERKQKIIDSLKEEALEERKPKIYPFNPNFITEYRAYTLGLSPSELKKIQDFRAADKWINSAADFKAVTGVSDTLLAEISPYFQFPEWVTNPRPKTGNKSFYNEKTFQQKKDLNLATAEELQEINGIGETLSQRIIKFRDRLKGFQVDEQLHDVYGLEYSVVKRIQAEFTVKEKPPVEKININKASASDLATLPFITFNMAREIVDYRYLHEGFTNLEELQKIAGFPAEKIDRFALYLTID